jgi:hypothetical protein
MKRDLYAEVSARIIAELEKGAAPWVKPWSATPGANTPCNAMSNRPYSGCNVVLLWMAQGLVRSLRVTQPIEPRRRRLRRCLPKSPDNPRAPRRRVARGHDPAGTPTVQKKPFARTVLCTEG